MYAAAIHCGIPCNGSAIHDKFSADLAVADRNAAAASIYIKRDIPGGIPGDRAAFHRKDAAVFYNYNRNLSICIVIPAQDSVIR